MQYKDSESKLLADLGLYQQACVKSLNAHSYKHVLTLYLGTLFSLPAWVSCAGEVAQGPAKPLTPISVSPRGQIPVDTQGDVGPRYTVSVQFPWELEHFEFQQLFVGNQSL